MKTNHLRNLKIILSASLILFVSPAFGGDFQLEVHDRTLSLRADDALFHDVLSALERGSGIRIEHYLRPDEKITADLKNVPLTKGIELLMREFNHSIVYAGSGRGNSAELETIFIYSRTGKTSTHLVWKSEVDTGKSTDHIPELIDLEGKINLHNSIPISTEAKSGMDMIDPLMRFATAGPDLGGNTMDRDYLPEEPDLVPIQK